MVCVSDIIGYVQEARQGALSPDEGLQHGSIGVDVKTVVVCWMATAGALDHAGRRGAQLVIAHESLYFPYDAVIRKDNPPGWETWPVNQQRRERLEKYGLTFLRLHGSLDQICIWDDFAARLGLAASGPRDREYDLRCLDIEPCRLSDLVQRVKTAVGMDHLRVSAPRGLDQRISRVGLLWGGMGLFVNVLLQAALLAAGCDVFIAGETDDYGFRFARDQGIPMIETSHEVSENFGLRRFGQMLQARFPDLTVDFYENKCPWEWV